jgi:hypothetical protein
MPKTFNSQKSEWGTHGLLGAPASRCAASERAKANNGSTRARRGARTPTGLLTCSTAFTKHDCPSLTRPGTNLYWCRDPNSLSLSLDSSAWWEGLAPITHCQGRPGVKAQSHRHTAASMK